jgi:hypothetical protein
MWEYGSHGEHDDEGNLTTFGMHSFSMVNVNGDDNVYACEGSGCHGPIGDSFSDKKYYVNGNADHDGNGVEEGLQDEVHGLLDTLASILPAAEGHNMYDLHDDPDTTWTLTEIQAAYNYQMVYYDHSYGIHNPAFTVSLLQTSIKAARGEIVAGIESSSESTPTKYALSQNYPNPFNPTTEIKFSIMKPGYVSLTVYDMLGRKVATLIDKEMQAGTYKTHMDGRDLASGIYIYRIQSGEFAAIRKMVLIK